MSRLVEVTELALRDGHQSLLATRMALEDMAPACEHIDRAGYWSVECWGGATYDACIRFLNEDPWERSSAPGSARKGRFATPSRRCIRSTSLSRWPNSFATSAAIRSALRIWR